jgi:hypothetical protein
METRRTIDEKVEPFVTAPTFFPSTLMSAAGTVPPKVPITAFWRRKYNRDNRESCVLDCDKGPAHAANWTAIENAMTMR